METVNLDSGIHRSGTVRFRALQIVRETDLNWSVAIPIPMAAAFARSIATAERDSE